ncbi:MAG: hypothetical protein E7031_07440 [Akkermansiaceae bacterium]|nr:hypothetical protein [Akkermansiaceae bacterium]
MKFAKEPLAYLLPDEELILVQEICFSFHKISFFEKFAFWAMGMLICIEILLILCIENELICGILSFVILILFFISGYHLINISQYGIITNKRVIYIETFGRFLQKHTSFSLDTLDVVCEPYRPEMEVVKMEVYDSSPYGAGHFIDEFDKEEYYQQLYEQKKKLGNDGSVILIFRDTQTKKPIFTFEKITPPIYKKWQCNRPTD